MKSIIIVGDTFPPLRTSGAVQLKDLSLAFLNKGYNVSVLVPGDSASYHCQESDFQGVRLIRAPSPKTKDINYLRRTLNEWFMPYKMIRSLRRSRISFESVDAVIWYSPSIFLYPLVLFFKKRFGCKSYLILRDIFPDWAVHMGLLKKGLAYRLLKFFESRQYRAADVIGVQSPANIEYFSDLKWANSFEVEVLHNWISKTDDADCPIDIEKTKLAGKTIFVYAGNMGVAQGMWRIFDLVKACRDVLNIGFVFVGRGSEVDGLKAESSAVGLDNVLFFDEIDPIYIPGLYRQCHVGIVSLDPRHKTHNVPGKFLTYVSAGLPVLASINDGNDLADIIQENDVGVAVCAGDVDALHQAANRLVSKIQDGERYDQRCKALADDLFSPGSVVEKIVSSLFGSRA